jgi:hypothetical protein
VDTTALAIAGLGTAVFVGVLVWKGVWFLRKINEEPGTQDEGNAQGGGRAQGEKRSEGDDAPGREKP